MIVTFSFRANFESITMYYLGRKEHAHTPPTTPGGRAPAQLPNAALPSVRRARGCLARVARVPRTTRAERDTNDQPRERESALRDTHITLSYIHILKNNPYPLSPN